MYSKDADLSHLKIFGARTFVHIKDAKKLEPKSWERMLSGFSEKEAFSYQIWNRNARKVGNYSSEGASPGKSSSRGVLPETS